MKYKPCYYCGEKPKAYKADHDGEWDIDHDCKERKGTNYLAASTLSGLIAFWNRTVEYMEKSEQQAKAAEHKVT